MDRICEHIESTKKEAKSDLDLSYRARYICLVDVNYCRHSCKTIKDDILIRQYGLQNPVTCIFKFPELDYAKIREAFRTGQFKKR